MMKSLIISTLLFASCLLNAGMVLRLDNGQQIKLYSDYHALIIGNSDYQHFPKLRGVKEDVQDLKAMFAKMNISTTVIEDCTSDQMKKALSDFVDIYGDAPDRALIFYYAGHGHTEPLADGSKLGYLVPTDAPLYETNKADFRKKSISMSDIENIAKLIQSKHVLMIFDSCFSGTIFTLKRAAPQVITDKTSQPVRQFIAAGTENEAVPDQSIFKTTFIKGVGEGFADFNQDGYITGEELGLYLEAEVVNYSKGNQHPQYGKIANPNLDRGDFVFALNAPIEEKTVSPPTSTSTPTFNPAAGSYISAQSVSITCATSGAAIRYTTDGSEPNSSSAVYNYPITVNRSTTLKAKAFKEGWTESSTASASYTINTFFPEMIYVPGGTFIMGGSNGSGESDEEPSHSVSLSSFYISKHQITQAECAQYMQPASIWTLDYGLGDDYPAYNISWYAALKYCNLLSMAAELTAVYSISGSTNPANWGEVPTGSNATWDAAICNWEADGYRLPTEAEWEYAARGATKAPDYLYSGSNDVHAVAWHDGNSDGHSHPVGSKAANSIGIYDMSGNVWEWCWDWYGSGYYQSSPQDNPKGPTNESYRVLRGGSWFNYALNCRLANRNGDFPDLSDSRIGLRILRRAIQ